MFYKSSSVSHTHRKRRLFLRAFALLLFFSLTIQLVSDWFPLISPALATGRSATQVQVRNPISLQQAIQNDDRDPRFSYGALQRPASVPPVPASTTSTATTGAAAAQQALKTPPSAEPATMQPASYQLDSSFLVGTPAAPKIAAKAALAPDASALRIAPVVVPSGSTPLVFHGSDGRLEVQIPRNALDLTHATVAGGTAPVAPLSLQISQISGHTANEDIVLGTYTVQIVDSQGHIVQGITFRQPATIVYHYKTDELVQMGVGADPLFVSQPQSIADARAANQSTTPYVNVMTNNRTSQTLTAQVTSLAGSLTLTSSPPLQTPAKPLLASEQGNSGQLAYSYPLTVPPGPGGFAPQTQPELFQRKHQRALCCGKPCQ